MKNVKKFMLRNTKTAIAFIIGILVAVPTVYAATMLAAYTVAYDNSNSSLQATNVQGAIDELYTKANNVYCTNGKTKQNETDYSYECK